MVARIVSDANVSYGGHPEISIEYGVMMNGTEDTGANLPVLLSLSFRPAARQTKAYEFGLAII